VFTYKNMCRVKKANFKSNHCNIVFIIIVFDFKISFFLFNLPIFQDFYMPFFYTNYNTKNMWFKQLTVIKSVINGNHLNKYCNGRRIWVRNIVYNDVSLNSNLTQPSQCLLLTQWRDTLNRKADRLPTLFDF